MIVIQRCIHCPGPTDVESGPFLCDSPCPDAFVWEMTWKSLHTPAEPVLPSEDITEIVDRLIAIARLQEGVGMAAPQIGVAKRIAIVNAHRSPLILVNPVISRHGRQVITAAEDCLTTKHSIVYVPRFRIIEIDFQDLNRQNQHLRLTDFDARVAQHEVDHLDGKLIVDLLP